MIVTLLPCALHTVHHWRKFAQICSYISVIENLSWRRFACVSNDFQRRFMWKSSIILIMLFVKFLTSLYLMKKITGLIILATTVLNILRSLVFLYILHACFYIDLLNHMLQCFVRYLNSRSTNETMTYFRDKTAHQLTAEMLRIKLIHLYLWKMSEKINHSFGWIICIAFFQYFVFVVYCVFNAFEMLLYMPTEMAFVKLLRESCEPSEWLWSVYMVIVAYFSGPITSVLTYAISIIVFAESCHRCSVWVIWLDFIPLHFDNRFHCSNRS